MFVSNTALKLLIKLVVEAELASEEKRIEATDSDIAVNEFSSAGSIVGGLSPFVMHRSQRTHKKKLDTTPIVEPTQSKGRGKHGI
jgi:hypothetical protein